MSNSPQASTDDAARVARERGDSRSGSATGIAGLPPEASEQWSDDAHHALRTPGGYEWWCFDALDAAGNGVVMVVFEGLPFHPNYLSVLARTRRKARNAFAVPRPDVLASYYPATYFAAYQGRRRVAQFLNLYPPGTFEGSRESPELRCGPNRITLRRDGSFGLVARGYPFELHGATPRARVDQVLSATLTFAPTFRGTQHVRLFRPRGPDGESHHWVLAAPHGRMTGRVQHIASSDGEALMDMHVDALGYHDHVYGQGPLGAGVRRVAWGYTVGDRWSAAWQWTSVSRGVRAESLVLFEKDGKPVVIDAPTHRIDQYRSTRWFTRYPRRITMHGSDAKGNSVEMLLNHQDLLEASPFHTRLDAAVSITIPGRRQYTGAGVTNLMQFRRLRWPVISDILLLAITPVREDDPLWRQ